MRGISAWARSSPRVCANGCVGGWRFLHWLAARRKLPTNANPYPPPPGTRLVPANPCLILGAGDPGLGRTQCAARGRVGACEGGART